MGSAGRQPPSALTAHIVRPCPAVTSSSQTAQETDRAGFEPAEPLTRLAGLANRTAVGANVVGSETCENRPSDLCASCAPDGRSWPDEAADDPELADVVGAWPRVPPAVRAGIVAMVRAATENTP